MFYPMSVYLGLTYACNLRCKHCYAREKHASRSLSYSEIKNLTNDLIDLFAVNFILGHGEPFLYPHIFDYLEYLKLKKANSIIMSNGYFLNKEKIDRLANVGPTEINISLDSMDKNIHDNNRGLEGAWDKAIFAIELLKSKDINVRIASVIDIKKIQNIDNMVRYCTLNNLNVNFLTIRDTSAQYSRKELINYFNVIEGVINTMSRNPDVDISIHDPLVIGFIKKLGLSEELTDRLIQKNSCDAGLYRISIDPNGDVYPCNMSNINLGNVKNEKIEKIWTSSKELNHLRNKKSCINCSHQEDCNGGCLAFQKNENNILLKDIRCIKEVLNG